MMTSVKAVAPTVTDAKRLAQLAELGRGVIRARLRARADALRARKIVDTVNRHVHESPIDLSERLRAINDEQRDIDTFTEAAINAELDRML